MSGDDELHALFDWADPGAGPAVGELPLPLRQLVRRAARLQRLLDLGYAPSNMLDAERRLVAETYVGVGVWLEAHALGPARERCETLFEEAAAERLRAHLAEAHGFERVADGAAATLNVLIELHLELHAHPHVGHEPEDGW